MADRWGALINGFDLDVETLQDSFEKAIAVYEYPFADGADTEDLGLKARRIKIRCYFLEENYAKHVDFLKDLARRDLAELTHPKYGIIKGRVETVAVSHDDRQQTAEIDISFVEERQKTTAPTKYADVQGAVEESFVTGQTNLMDSYAGDVVTALGPEAYTILNTDLDPDLGILEQFGNVSRKARTYLKSVESWTGTLVEDLAEVSNPANSLTSLITYPDNLAGRVIGSLARTVERYVLARDTMRLAPARFLDSLRLGFAGVTEAAAGYDEPTVSTEVSLANPARVAAAQRMSVEAGTIFAEDEQRRQELRRVEKAKSFDTLGNYLAPDPAPKVMTVQELERSLAMTRISLQDAIDQTRATDNPAADRTIAGLKSMAQDLQEHVGEIKLERDRIVPVSLDNPLPLHLVCLRHGLSYRYADRLQAINNIKHPNFTDGEVLIYA